MAVTTPPAEAKVQRRSRLTGVRRAFAPVAEARGMTRTMLWIGAGITLAFVLIALLAPVIAPYDFDTFEVNGKRFPQLAPPSRDHLMGTNVQSTDVLSRVIWGTGRSEASSLRCGPPRTETCSSSFGIGVVRPAAIHMPRSPPGT